MSTLLSSDTPEKGLGSHYRWLSAHHMVAGNWIFFFKVIVFRLGLGALRTKFTYQQIWPPGPPRILQALFSIPCPNPKLPSPVAGWAALPAGALPIESRHLVSLCFLSPLPPAHTLFLSFPSSSLLFPLAWQFPWLPSLRPLNFLACFPINLPLI